VQALQALGYLAVATVLGVVLSVAPRSADTLRLAKAYAVCGLLGFHGTMILAVSGRHLPVLMWTRRMHESGPPTVSPYRLRSRAIATLELATWSAGVPLLAFSLWRESTRALSAAAWMLLAAVAASAANQVRALRHPALRAERHSAVADGGEDEWTAG
jgi:hypothetical protein